MNFKLNKPDLSRINNEDFFHIFSEKNEEIFAFVQSVATPKYLYWDKVKHKEPSPAGVSKEILWKFVKTLRNSQKKKSVIKTENNNYFSWSKTPDIEEFFHLVDMNTGGFLTSFKDGIDKDNRQKLISRGVMEEAIASSQLEGADTTRKVAKQFLREGRKPKNESERMILNNYLAMKRVEEDYRDSKLSLGLILEMHKSITSETVDSEGEKPKLRKAGDDVFVKDTITGKVFHKGPNAKFVKKELERLIKFANDELDASFLHPVIKAIMLHFWLAYLHPFTDGNGRLARLLFYWYLLKKDYWAFSYLPISLVIKKSQEQYKMAFVYSEQDDYDLTYFIDYNIRKINIAIKDFNDYVKKKARGNAEMNKLAKVKYNLNERQIHLLQFFYGDMDNTKTNLSIHMNIHQIAKMTAIKDLKDLVSKKFILDQKQGRNVYYYPLDKIKKLF